VTASERIAAIVAGDGRREAKARELAEVICSAGRYRWAGVYDVGAEAVSIVGWAGAGQPEHPSFPIGRGLTAEAIASARPVVVGSTRERADYLPTFGDTRSELIVPVVVRGAVEGTLDVESPEEDAFSAADVAFLQHCAAVAMPLWIRAAPNGPGVTLGR
jgi:GAF domain-containing protein